MSKVIPIAIINRRRNRTKTVRRSTNIEGDFSKLVILGVDQNSSHDEDESGDSYLHPLLRGRANNDNNNNLKKKSDETVRVPPVQMNIHNTAYGQLIKKYEHLRQRDK